MSANSLLSASAAPAPAKPLSAGSPSLPGPEGSGSVAAWRPLVLLILALLTVFTYWYNPPMEIQPQAGVIMKLPVILGDYFGKQGEITEIEHNILPADTEFARRFYVDSHGHEIDTTIVLSGAEQRSIHRPEACLVGQGWTIIGQDNIPIVLQSGRTMMTRKLSLERQVIQENGEHLTVRAFYVYWFVGQNVTTPSHFTRILLSNWDRVIHNRAHRWAYVSMFSMITDNLAPNGLNGEQTQKLITDFTKQIVPTFQIDEMPAQAQN